MYLSVVIDLLFTVSLMLLWQLNQVLRSASPAGKTHPEHQGMPLPPAPASAALPGLARAACSRLCYTSAGAALGTCQEHPACVGKTVAKSREGTLFISDVSFVPSTLRLLHRKYVQAMPL